VPHKNTFTSHEKLKSKKFTELLFKKGAALYSFPFRVVYLQKTATIKLPQPVDFVADFPIKFGVSVSTKNFKRAVDRNRVKRLTREAWRLQKQQLYEIAKKHNVQIGVFFVYTQKEILSQSEISIAVQKAIKKLSQIIAAFPPIITTN
jgi:ribonuclease P protein component